MLLRNYHVAMMTKIDNDPSTPHCRAGENGLFFSIIKYFQYYIILDYDSMCSETDFTQEKVNF